MRFIFLLFVAMIFTVISCETSSSETGTDSPYPTTGSIEKMDDRLDEIVAPGAVIEVLTDTFTWSEGPVWIGGEDGFLVFTDVPENKAWKWSEEGGKELYLDPSGYTGPEGDLSGGGANGLRLDLGGNLVLCQHGDRRVARMMSPVEYPQSKFQTITDNYQGMRFNSPNDLCYDSDGYLYFTDPPYGLPLGQNDTINRELSFNGIYVVLEGHPVELIDSTMTRPNGIALSLEEDRLYVANSDPNQFYWKVFERQEDGRFGNGQVFLDVTSERSEENKGSPDGLRVMSTGELVATGPGGVWVISSDGTPLGRIRTGEPTANCEIAADGYLYMTANHQLMRVKMERR